MIEPSADRIVSLCPIAGVAGAGCCDLAFALPEAARALKAHVVANQLERLGGHRWNGEAQPISDLRGPADYKRDVVRVLTQRAIRKAIARATGGA